ncbi:MAG: hypothetical protein ACXVP5_10975 [Tumebacillaceae bacterium]
MDFFKRKTVWSLIGACVVVIISVWGVLRITKPPVDQVKWAYASAALPGYSSKKVYFPDRDREQLSKMLTLIQTAQEVTDEDLRWPKRSETLTIVMKDGHTYQVDNAWECRTTGPKSSTCSNVPDRVTIQDDKRKPSMYFAKSPDLYKLLIEMERTQPTGEQDKYPKSVAVGSTFSIEGNGWLTDKVTVSLKQNNSVLWKGDAVPDHGHFSMQVKCPDDVVPGDYTLEYSGVDWTTHGYSISITDRTE